MNCPEMPDRPRFDIVRPTALYFRGRGCFIMANKGREPVLFERMGGDHLLKYSFAPVVNAVYRGSSTLIIN